MLRIYSIVCLTLCMLAIGVVDIRAELSLLRLIDDISSDKQQSASSSAGPQQVPRSELPLWPDGAPGALGKEAKDIPTLMPYFAPPLKATGAAIIICPGG